MASCPFFLDIDAAADLDEARAQTLRACDLLTERVGIVPESMDLHFSGAKRFHLILPPQVLGDPTGADLIRLWQCLARRMVREGLSHVDLGVYQTARLIRLPNSVNSRSRLYKVPLEYKELRDLHLADILDLAKAPREWDSMAVPVESDRAIAWLATAREWLQRQPPGRLPDRTHNRAEGWRTPPCIRRIESTILPDGVRHQTYYVLARFYATIGMAEREAVDRLREIDHRHPIRDPDYLERVVHNAWAHPGFAGCPNPVLDSYCDSRTCHLKRPPQTAAPSTKLEKEL